MSISATFDLLLRGGRVIMPGLGHRRHQGRRHPQWQDRGRPARHPADQRAGRSIDVTGKIVLPGLIDTHAHVYQYVTGRFGMNADMVGVQSGVTTLVDQGGPSCMTLPGFRHFIAEQAKSRVYAFLSAYLVGGLEGHYYPNLYSPDGVDIDATVKAATRQLAISCAASRRMPRSAASRAGAFASSKWRPRSGAAPICRSMCISASSGACRKAAPMARTSTPSWQRVIPLLREGDVLAHPFTRHPGGFVNREGEVHPVIQAALDRGLKVDVGHGSHFSYRLARKAIAAGIVPTTLGADIHGYNTHVPAPAGTPDAACRRREPSVRRPGQVQPGAGDEFDDGARPHAGAGGADGDVESGRDARRCPTRSARCKVGMDADVIGARRNSPAASSCATTRRTKWSPTACCSRRSACAPACATMRSRRSCRRPSRRRTVGIGSVEENVRVRNERDFPSADAAAGPTRRRRPAAAQGRRSLDARARPVRGRHPSRRPAGRRLCAQSAGACADPGHPLCRSAIATWFSRRRISTGVKPIRAVSGLPGFKISEQPVLATGKVRQVGELVAMCVAPTRAEAEDIAASVTLDLEELPAVYDMLQGARAGCGAGARALGRQRLSRNQLRSRHLARRSMRRSR